MEETQRTARSAPAYEIGTQAVAHFLRQELRARGDVSRRVFPPVFTCLIHIFTVYQHLDQRFGGNFREAGPAKCELACSAPRKSCTARNFESLA